MAYRRKKHWWIGLVGSLLVVVFSLQVGSAARFEGQYIPVGHDSFYHGARIRDALESGSVPQFDARIHAPAGDWVTWPWAYDAVLAAVGRVARSTLNLDPMAAVAHVPIALGVSAALALLFILGRLRLPIGLTLVAMLCFGVSGITQSLYGVGVLDHHGAEQLMMLLVLGFGAAWRQQADVAAWPLLLGLCLGLALGVHASMVALQLPLVATLLLGWRSGEVPTRHGSWRLAAGLAVGLLFVMLPAATFRQGRFDLYYLTWLQLYCSMITVGIAVVSSRWSYSPRRAIVLAVALLALALPLDATVRFSASFLASDLPAIARIDETRSPFEVAKDPGGFARISRFYSLLIWLAPLSLLGSAVMAFRDSDAARGHFWVWATFGLTLTILQQRLVSLGALFLFLAPLLLLAVWLANRPRAVRMAYVLAALGMVVAFAPTLRHQLLAPRIPAMDEQFVTLRPLLPALTDVCRRHPGIVLATPGDGHIVRYFTDCGVVSNNFRLTPLDIERISTTLELIRRPASELPQAASYVDYVLARLVEPAESEDPVLFSELLNPVGDAAWPSYRSIVEVGVNRPDGSRVDFLGLFAVPTRSPAS
jgi:hypothetical protein